MNSVAIKRSPIVLIAIFVVIEVAGFVAYSLAAFLGDYKVHLYTALSLPSVLSYQYAKFLLLSGAQLVITVYGFLRWYYEMYTVRPGVITYERGVFFKRKKEVPLERAISVTTASGPVGKLLHYGSIHIHGADGRDAVVLADISYPEKYLKVIKKFAHAGGGRGEETGDGRREKLNGERPDLAKLLSEEEHEQLEFKSSLRFDYKSQNVNRELERMAMKTVAAFLNSKGGRLVIGVGDRREPIGLESDYKTLGRQTSDGFENHFTQIFNAMVGPEFRHCVKLWFDAAGGRDVCVVDVAPSARPAYLKFNNDESFYVRTGNVSTPLKMSEAESYMRVRWPQRRTMVS
jgi:membrane protein YdbS with pleckstrin-like domain